MQQRPTVVLALGLAAGRTVLSLAAELLPPHPQEIPDERPRKTP